MSDNKLEHLNILLKELTTEWHISDEDKEATLRAYLDPKALRVFLSWFKEEDSG